MKERIVALIPMRGGSKSIPKKNIKNIAGKPLCAWVIEEVKKVNEIDEVYVSTDDNEIAELVKELNLNINILWRPPEYAKDESSTEEVMLHFASEVDFDILITLQVTSPLTQADDILNGIYKLLNYNYDSLLTGTRNKRFFWSLDGKPLNYNPKQRPRRQDFDGLIMENGALYLTRRSVLVNEKCRLGGKIGILEMSEETAIEIDEPEDWTCVENILIKRKKLNLFEKLKNVKLLILDVDGTLTDGGMYYSASGEKLKKFNTRDAHGLAILRRHNMKIAVITSENSSITHARIEKMGISVYYYGITDKKSCMQEICKKINIKLEEIVYIGDDLGDIDSLKAVGFSACPADAVDNIKNCVDYVCQKNGGEGAVREVCDLLLSVR